MNKKGLEMAWSTIVVMILALLLLLFLILFFTNSSGNFLEKVKSYSSYSNVDSSVQSCNILIQAGNTYSFCCEKKQIKYYENGVKKSSDFSCVELSNKEFINSQINKMDCGGIIC
jgi:hypothetical protein